MRNLAEFAPNRLRSLTSFVRATINLLNPFAYAPAAPQLPAPYELVSSERIESRRADFVSGENDTPAVSQILVERPFCRLLSLNCVDEHGARVPGNGDKPAILVCAPLSRHHTIFLQDTVCTLQRDHRVFVVDWIDARMVPVAAGVFDLEAYVSYIQEFIRHIGAWDLNVLAIEQATVPVLAAISLMASRGEATPRTMTLMGGPIDARCSPTEMNLVATRHPHEWFEFNASHAVPAEFPGAGRRVYPGEGAEAHPGAYVEDNPAQEIAAEFYLQTIRVVFQEFLLARGIWEIAGQPVRPQDITETALFTVEGAIDNISGDGQTRAAHDLCTHIRASRKRHLTVEECGHYGIFAGRHWRTAVYPQLRDLIREYSGRNLREPTCEAH